MIHPDIFHNINNINNYKYNKVNNIIMIKLFKLNYKLSKIEYYINYLNDKIIKKSDPRYLKYKIRYLFG